MAKRHSFLFYGDGSRVSGNDPQVQGDGTQIQRDSLRVQGQGDGPRVHGDSEGRPSPSTVTLPTAGCYPLAEKIMTLSVSGANGVV